MEKNKEYRIKGKHPYFKDKYGTDNPVFRVEDTDKEIFGKSWFDGDNPCAMLFGMRMGLEGKSIEEVESQTVYYGHIVSAGLGELVLESELEEIDGG